MSGAAIAANLGAVATLALGALGLFAPARAAAMTGIAPIGLAGRSEIRATYGGLFCALGAWCLASQSGVVFLTAGVAWLGAALARTTSVVVDGNREAKNFGGIGLEAGIGALLSAPAWAAG